jgi:hypothetical protein
MSFTVDVHHHILPDFWRETNDAYNPVGGIAPPPWDTDLLLDAPRRRLSGRSESKGIDRVAGTLHAWKRADVTSKPPAGVLLRAKST